ncbi:MAG: inositol monophosphatase [Bacteroidales bacterium]|nr:inositol monophosphatase [Bacteroidales bacterium]
MKLDIITKQVVNLTKTVGQFIKSEVDKLDKSDIEEKGIHNLVTYVDKESEKILVKELGIILPEAGFIAEEDASLTKSVHLNWVIDPLDGTTNFIHRVPLYAISIALMDRDEVIIGVIYEINLKECFYAWKNSPAFLNGKEIHVSNTDSLNDSLLATGFPYYDYSMLDPYLDMFKDLMQTTRGVRRLGSAAVDLAYVACGRFDLFYEYGLQSWDVAAGALIVKQAGGKVSDFQDKKNYVFGKQLIASNNLTHNEFITKIQYFFE